MSENDSLKNIPKISYSSFHRLQCPVYAAMKDPRLPSNLSAVLLNLEPGQLLYTDFAFMNVVSVCGFQSYLSCTDDSSGYSFTFPTWNKQPSLDFLWFIVISLR